MGLRQSVKQDEPIKSANKPPLRQQNQNHCNCEQEPSASSSADPPQREAWTARGQLLLNFHHAISRALNSPEMIQKCDEIAKDMHRTRDEAAQQSQHQQQLSRRSRSLSKDYTAEAQLIVENKSRRDAHVRNKSLAAGLFSFVVLRGSRGLSALMRRSIANRHRGTSMAAASSSYKFDKPAHLLKNATPNTTASSTTTATTTATTIASTAAAASSTKEPSKLRKLFRVTIDLTISTTIALLSGTFLFLPKPSAYIEDMSKLPLVEGKSVYAEMVCPPLLKEYKRVMEEYGGRWPVASTSSSSSGDAATSTSIANNKEESTRKNNGSGGITQEDVSLNIIRKFVENCSKRSIYEQALREERSALLSSPSSGSSNSLEDALTVSRLIRRLTASSSSRSSSSSAPPTMTMKMNAGDENDGATTTHSNASTNNKLGTVSIPSPGVPENISVDLDVDVFSLAPAATNSTASSTK